MASESNTFDLIRIGKGLAVLRRQRDNMSQNELATRSGVSQNTISRMESGESFELINLLAVLKVLDRKVGDFLVDVGFTDESDILQDYEMVVKFKARRLRSISGNVTGPGIGRAKGNDTTNR